MKSLFLFSLLFSLVFILNFKSSEAGFCSSCDSNLLGSWNAGGNTLTFTETGFSGIISGFQCSGTYLVDISKSPHWLDLVVNLPYPLRIEAIYLHDVTGPGDRQLILQLPLNINLILGIGLRPLSITAGAFLFNRLGVVAGLGDSWLLGRFACNDGLSVITFTENGRFTLSLPDLQLVGHFVVDLTKAPYWLDLFCDDDGGKRLPGLLVPAIYQHSLINGVKSLIIELPPVDKIISVVRFGGLLSRPLAFLTHTVFALVDTVLDLLLRNEPQLQQQQQQQQQQISPQQLAH